MSLPPATTILTGTFARVDGTPISGANIVITLLSQETAAQLTGPYKVSGVFLPNPPSAIIAQTDAAGFFTAELYGNDEIQTASPTYYNVSYGNFDQNYQFIAGTTYDLSSAVPINPPTFMFTPIPAGSQPANEVLASAVSGGLAIPSFRKLVRQDLPGSTPLYVSQFAGADLGAQINAAIAFGVANGIFNYVIDIAGTITTPVVGFPLGSSVNFTCGNITLAAPFPINHRGCTFNFNSCQVISSLNSGSGAIVVGKNLSGVVNTTGSTVNWVSGSTFETFDTGDEIAINGGLFNIASVASPTQLTVLGSVGTNTAVSMGQGNMGLSADLGTFSNSVAIRDLNLVYVSGSVSTGFLIQNVTNPLLENVAVLGFTNGVKSLGMLTANFESVKINVCKNALLLDQSVVAGVTVTSNFNKFSNLQVFASTSGGNPLLVQNGSSANIFISGDFESNQGATAFCQIGSGSTLNRFESCDHENNSVADYIIAGDGTQITGCSFAGSTNTPASGLVASAAISVYVANNAWSAGGGAYASGAIVFTGTASGTFVNNQTGTAQAFFGSNAIVIGNSTPGSMTSNVTAEKIIANGISSGTASPFLSSASGQVGYAWQNTAAGTDAKIWDQIVGIDANTMRFRILNDAQSSAISWLTVTRSGTSAASMVFGGDVSLAGNVTLGGSGAHINSATANSDVCGVLSSASGTTVSHSFTTPFASTPVVQITATSNCGFFYLSAVSNSGFTITYANSGTASFNYTVIGNPN